MSRRLSFTSSISTPSSETPPPVFVSSEEVEQSDMNGSLRAGHKLKWPRKEPKPGGGGGHWKKKRMLRGKKGMSREGDLAPQQDILPANVLAHAMYNVTRMCCYVVYVVLCYSDQVIMGTGQI